MSNDARSLHLDQPGTAWDIVDSSVADRKPLSMLPSSPTRINWARLPDSSDLHDMELAFRQQLVPDSAGLYMARNIAGPILLIAYLLAMAIPMFAAALPFLSGLTAIGAVTSFAIVFRYYRSRKLTFFFVLGTVLFGLFALLLLHTLSFVFANRVAGSAIIAGVAMVFIHRFGAVPTEFYYDWIYTAAHLRPEDRLARKPVIVRPDLKVFALIILVALVVPLISSLAAILAIAGLCAYACRRERFGLDLIPKTLDLLSPYLTHGTRLFAYMYQYLSRGVPSAPGVWSPVAGPGFRSMVLFWMTLLVSLPLALSLCFFIPYELVSEPLFKVFDAHVMDRDHNRADFHAQYPGVNLNDAPARPLPPPVDYYGRPPAQPPKPDPRVEGERLAAGAKYIRSVLREYPSVAPYLILYGTTDIDPAVSWYFIFGLLIGIPICTWVLLAMYREPLLELAARRRLIEDMAKDDPRPEWQWYLDRIRTSLHEARDPLGNTVREANHLFLGVEPYFRFPMLLDRAVLAEHAYIVGESGSGKTALGIIPLLIQLIRGHAVRAATPSTSAQPSAAVESPARTDSIYRKRPVELSPPPPMVVIDLKGDPALFHTLREECAERRIQMGITDSRDPRCAFRFFSLEPNKHTHVFNPFADLMQTQCSIMQVCQLLLDSLGLAHGEGYGRSYYSRKNRHLLLTALKHANPPVRSFDELYPVVAKLAKTREHRECFELVSTIYAIAEYEQIAMFQPLKRPEDAIHMPAVLEHGQVVYFWLPAALESSSVREVAKLALFSFLTAAIDRQRRGIDGETPKQAYLVIDEFQRIAAENFKVILEQARSFGISAILANQSQADLITHDLDLRPTVRTNTRFKQYFAIGDPDEIAALKIVSGEEILRMRSYTVDANSAMGAPRSPRETGAHDQFKTKTESDLIKPRLMTNDIAALSDHPLQSIIHILRGSGYTQFAGLPVPLQSTWPMHFAEYRRRQQLPWPERDEYEMETVVPRKSIKEVDDAIEERTAEQKARIDAQIQALIDEDGGA